MGSSKPTIGFQYFLGMHMCFCHNDPDSPIDEVEQILAGERIAWQPTPNNDATRITESRRIFIDNPNLFGGSKKEGGIQGFVDVEFGEPDQGPNEYLRSVAGQIQPAYRGILGFVLNQVYVTAITPYIKPWWAIIRRSAAKHWFPETADINGGANGIHIMYEAWTNPDWGLGYPASTLDDANWRAAAQTVFDQGLSLSLVYGQESTVENFIFQILSHINGVMYTDYRTGLQRVRILTDDYDPETLLSFDENNIITLESYSRPGYSDLINEVTVTYRRQAEKEDSSVTVQSLAIINAQEGIVSQTIPYPGIDTDENAALIAERDLKQLSTPLAKITIVVNRDAFALYPGDVFRFSWAAYGISNMVCRVMNIDFGNLQDRQIRIDAVEDIFGLGSTTYIEPQETLWDDPYVPPAEITDKLLLEAPYYLNVLEFGQEAAEQLTFASAYAIGASTQPDEGNNIGHAFYYAETANGFAGLDEPIVQTNNTAVLINESLIAIDDTSWVYRVESQLERLVTANSYLYINEEFMFVESIDYSTRTVTVKRGVLDTIPRVHTSTRRAYLIDQNNYSFDPEEHFVNETAYYWLQGWSFLGFNPPSEDSTDSVTFTGRSFRPYPPANVLFNGDSFPADSRGDFTIEWSGRNRLLSTAPDSAVGWFEGPQAPEPGTTYTIQVFDAEPAIPVFIEEFTDLTVDPQTNTGSFNFRPGNEAKERYFVTIQSVNSQGYQSTYNVQHTFDVFGYGFDYGNRYGGAEEGVYLRPGGVIPPSGNRIPMPDPLWLDDWSGITQSDGENFALTTDRFTWDGGVNGIDWQISNITESTGVRNINEYGNDILVYTIGSTSSAIYLKRGNADWEFYENSEFIPVGSSVTFIPELNHFIIVNSAPALSGNVVVTTPDFINFTKHEELINPGGPIEFANPLFEIMQARKIFFNGTDYIAAGESLDSGVGNREYVVARSNGLDLLDWTLNDTFTPTLVFNPIYRNGNWYIYDTVSPGQIDSFSRIYSSPDLYTWTQITPNIAGSDDNTFEGILHVAITDTLVYFQGDRFVYSTTNFSTFNQSAARYNLVNDPQAPINPLRGKSIFNDTRGNGPQRLLIRTGTAQELGCKVLSLESLTTLPNAVALNYPITAPYSNFVGMISRRNNVRNGIYNGSMTISGLDAEGFLGHASGKRYFEITSTGFITSTYQVGLTRHYGSEDRTFAQIYALMNSDGEFVAPNRLSNGIGVATPFEIGDVIGVGVNFDDNQITFYRNGDLIYTFEDSSQVQYTWYPYIQANASNIAITINVGQELFQFLPAGFSRWWS